MRFVLTVIGTTALLATLGSPLTSLYHSATESVCSGLLPESFDVRVKSIEEAKRITVASSRFDNIIFVRQRGQDGRIRVRLIAHSRLQTLLWPIAFGLVLVGSLCRGSLLRRTSRFTVAGGVLLVFAILRTCLRVRHEASTAGCFDGNEPPSDLSLACLDFLWTGEIGATLLALLTTALLCKQELSMIIATEASKFTDSPGRASRTIT